MLTYWGQGAHLLRHPEDASAAFWKSVPQPMFWPMFVAAILASTVASQVCARRYVLAQFCAVQPTQRVQRECALQLTQLAAQSESKKSAPPHVSYGEVTST